MCFITRWDPLSTPVKEPVIVDTFSPKTSKRLTGTHIMPRKYTTSQKHHRQWAKERKAQMPWTRQRKENTQTLWFQGSPQGDQISERKCWRHKSRKERKNSTSWYLHKGQNNSSWNVNWEKLGTWTGCLCVAGLRLHKQVMQATNSLSTMGPSMTKDILLRMPSAKNRMQSLEQRTWLRQEALLNATPRSNAANENEHIWRIQEQINRVFTSGKPLHFFH